MVILLRRGLVIGRKLSGSHLCPWLLLGKSVLLCLSVINFNMRPYQPAQDGQRAQGVTVLG